MKANPKPVVKKRRPEWIAGLPAILFMAAGLIMMLNLLVNSHKSDLKRYREDADNAMIVGDFARARVCYERVLAEDPGDVDAQHGLEQCLAGLRRLARQGAEPIKH